MPASISSFCGSQAAPRTCLGNTVISLTVLAFTCARKPQKSHTRSAHLKFGGNFLRDFSLLHFGHLQSFTTMVSPYSPSFCLSVATIFPLPANARLNGSCAAAIRFLKRLLGVNL